MNQQTIDVVNALVRKEARDFCTRHQLPDSQVETVELAMHHGMLISDQLGLKALLQNQQEQRAELAKGPVHSRLRLSETANTNKSGASQT